MLYIMWNIFTLIESIKRFFSFIWCILTYKVQIRCPFQSASTGKHNIFWIRYSYGFSENNLKKSTSAV